MPAYWFTCAFGHNNIVINIFDTDKGFIFVHYVYFEPLHFQSSLRILHNRCLKTLGVLDINRLYIAVEFLLGILLVVSLSRDADSQAERHALDTRLPHLLLQLGIETNVASTLFAEARPI